MRQQPDHPRVCLQTASAPIPAASTTTTSLNTGDHNSGTVTPVTNQSSPRAPSTTTPTIKDVDSVPPFPHCNRVFAARIGLVRHLRIHRTATGASMSGASTYTCCMRLHCPHCPRTFIHCMGLFGHMHIHDNEIHHTVDTPSTSPTFANFAIPSLINSPSTSWSTTSSTAMATDTCVSTRAEFNAAPTRLAHPALPPCLAPPTLRRPARPPPPASLHSAHRTHPPCSAQPTYRRPAAIITSSTITTIEPDTDTADFSCPHCSRAFTWRIGLVGHLRIHCVETDESVPGASAYTRRIRLYCPHCPRTFTHRMGLLGRMRAHENLR
ncbi:hypothetical protein SprV_0501861800 [Sparganum proliferum]